MQRLTRHSWWVAGLLVGLTASAEAATSKLTALINWYSVEEHKAAWQELIQRFQAANPDLELEVLVGGNEDRLRTMILSGTAPDVVHFDRYKVGEWAFNGLFQPIDQYLTGINPRMTFLNGPLQEALFKGRLYAIPTDTDIRGLFWNVAQLNESGLPGERGPQTWEELNDFARKLTRFKGDGTPERVGLVPWVGNWYWHAWMWSFGGDYFDAATFQPTLNRSENVRAFEWMAEFAKRYGTPAQLNAAGISGDMWVSFTSGRISMVPAHHYAAVRFRQANPNLDMWGGPVPHPAGGRNGTWSGGLALVMPQGAKHPEAAARFLQFMARPEVQVRFYELTGAIPATLAGLRQIVQRAEPLYRVFLAQSDVANWRHPFTGIIGTAANQAQNEVINLQKPAQQALDEAQQRLLSQYSQLWQR